MSANITIQRIIQPAVPNVRNVIKETSENAAALQKAITGSKPGLEIKTAIAENKKGREVVRSDETIDAGRETTEYMNVMTDSSIRSARNIPIIKPAIQRNVRSHVQVLRLLNDDSDTVNFTICNSPLIPLVCKYIYTSGASMGRKRV